MKEIQNKMSFHRTGMDSSDMKIMKKRLFVDADLDKKYLHQKDNRGAERKNNHRSTRGLRVLIIGSNTKLFWQCDAI